MPITVEIDEKQLDDIKKMTDGLSPAEQEKVMYRAMKRAGDTARTETTKALKNRYEIKAAKAKKDIKLKVQKTGAALEIKGYHRDLADFSVKPGFKPPTLGKSTAGVPSPTVTVVKGEGGKIRDSFWSQVGGHKGIFRQGNNGKSAEYRLPQMAVSTPKVKKKLPINEPTGPAVAQMANKIEEDVDISGKVLEKLDERVTHEMNRILGGND